MILMRLIVNGPEEESSQQHGKLGDTENFKMYGLWTFAENLFGGGGRGGVLGE